MLIWRIYLPLWEEGKWWRTVVSVHLRGCLPFPPLLSALLVCFELGGPSPLSAVVGSV